MESCKRRQELLNESRKLHEFIDSCGELMTWINANIQLAYDESFLDPTNLRLAVDITQWQSFSNFR